MRRVATSIVEGRAKCLWMIDMDEEENAKPEGSQKSREREAFERKENCAQ
jgi:hypothetical protein